MRAAVCKTVSLAKSACGLHQYFKNGDRKRELKTVSDGFCAPFADPTDTWRSTIDAILIFFFFKSD